MHLRVTFVPGGTGPVNETAEWLRRHHISFIECERGGALRAAPVIRGDLGIAVGSGRGGPGEGWSLVLESGPRRSVVRLAGGGCVGAARVMAFVRGWLQARNLLHRRHMQELESLARVPGISVFSIGEEHVPGLRAQLTCVGRVGVAAGVAGAGAGAAAMPAGPGGAVRSMAERAEGGGGNNPACGVVTQCVYAETRFCFACGAPPPMPAPAPAHVPAPAGTGTGTGTGMTRCGACRNVAFCDACGAEHAEHGCTGVHVSSRVTHIGNMTLPPTCAGCGVAGTADRPLLRCADCARHALYCGAACQRAHWRAHKPAHAAAGRA